MKKIKNSVVVTVALLMLVFSLLLMTGCGGVKLDAGTYEGTYTCEYKVGETEKWGYTATFTVDENNVIWNLQLTNPEGYSGSIGSRPWDLSKFTQQFSGLFTVDDIAKMEVEVNAAGYPEGTDCVKSNKDVLLLVGFESNCAIAILAMQNAISEAVS